jgi:hypothetical protein
MVLQPLGERLTADQLHGEEVLAVVGPAHLVDRGDRRVLEPGEGLGFSPEQLDLLLVDVGPAADDLERYGALGVLLLGLVDDPHAARAETADDAEVPDPLGQTRSVLGRLGRLGRWAGIPAVTVHCVPLGGTGPRTRAAELPQRIQRNRRAARSAATGPFPRLLC